MTDTVQTLLRQRAQESCPATPRGEGLARDARHADCQIVLSDTAHLPLLEGLDLGGARVLDVGGAEWKELVSSADPDTAPFEEMRPSDLSILIFTSGTSGGAEGGPRDPREGRPPRRHARPVHELRGKPLA